MAMILKSVGPGRGAYWVRDGLRLYLKRPLAFTALFVLFLFAALFIALVPLVGGASMAFFVSTLLMRHSIMTRKIAARGVAVPTEYAGVTPRSTD